LNEGLCSQRRDGTGRLVPSREHECSVSKEGEEKRETWREASSEVIGCEGVHNSFEGNSLPCALTMVAACLVFQMNEGSTFSQPYLWGRNM
jgi:hypothetical protein